MNPGRRACLLLLLSFPAWGLGGSRASVGPLPETDGELSNAVSERLDRDPELRRNHIRVTADAGVVRLTGKVASLGQRRETIRLAASQRGVLEIDPDLALQGAKPADITLRRRVRRLLAAHSDLAAPSVAIHIEGAQASVTGEVHSVGRHLFLRDRLEGLPGLESVDLSGLRVGAKPADRLDTEALRAAVLHLIRDPYVFPLSGRIEVETRDSMLALTGTVPRLIDKMEALDVAALVVDRERLQDELLIDPEFGRLRQHSSGPQKRRFR